MKIFWQTAIFLTVFVLGTLFAYAGKKTPINSGKPVPYIGKGEDSQKFIMHRLAKDSGMPPGHFKKFASGFVDSVSQLTGEEQTEVWYGP